MAGWAGEASALRAPVGIESFDDVFRVESLRVGNALLLIDEFGEDYAVGEAEAGDEIVLQDLAAEGVGARLEDGPEARLGVDGAESAEGFADGGGVVGEVVDDGDAGDLGADFKPAFDAFEGGEGGLDGGERNALMGGEGGGGGGVEGVVLAGQMHFEVGPGGVVAEDLPAGAVVYVAEILDAPVGGLREAVALDGAEGVGDAVGDVGAAVVGDDDAGGGGRD